MVNKMTFISEAEVRVRSQGAVDMKFVRDNFFCKYFVFLREFFILSLLLIYSSIFGGLGNGPVRVHSSTDPTRLRKYKKTILFGEGTFEASVSSLSPLLQFKDGCRAKQTSTTLLEFEPTIDRGETKCTTYLV